jgi:ABC-2 type transport system ATP-binding protein
MQSTTTSPTIAARAAARDRDTTPGGTVSFHRASKSFGPIVALDGLTLDIPAGQTVALLGPNGAGKSTAIGLMLGLLEPTDGAVRVLGSDPRAAVASGRVGAMLQTAGLPAGARVRELIDFATSLYPRPLRTPDVLARAALAPIAGRRVEGLSGGEAQRVRFALAIAGDPDLVFLDEPTVAMDVESRRAFWDDMRAFAAQGRTVLFATHYLEEADQVADRIVVLDHGRIVADGTGASIKASVAERAIRFTLPAAEEALLQRLDGVTSVRIVGDAVTLETSDADATVRGLVNGAIPFHDLEVAGADLEQAFLDLISADARPTRANATTRRTN